MTNVVCENLLRDVDLVLMSATYNMRFKTSYIKGVYNDNLCIKYGPNNPSKWGEICFICKTKNQKVDWTIFAPFTQNNFKTYCICKTCSKTCSDYYLESLCISYENMMDELVNDYM